MRVRILTSELFMSDEITFKRAYRAGFDGTRSLICSVQPKHVYQGSVGRTGPSLSVHERQEEGPSGMLPLCSSPPKGPPSSHEQTPEAGRAPGVALVRKRGSFVSCWPGLC